MAAAGHELVIHGWDHQCRAWKPPGRLADELRRTRDSVFLLREVFGFEYDEIAAATEKTQAAVRQLAHRARQHVRAARAIDGTPDTTCPSPLRMKSTQQLLREGNCKSSNPTWRQI